jgi:hypothetical protein
MSTLDRKTPSNPRFANVKPTLDTGMNMRKVVEQYQGTSGAHAHKKRSDEFFVRLRPATLSRLLQPMIDGEESIYQLGRDDCGSVVSSVAPHTAAGSSSEGRVLVLDLRSFEDFEQCHVFGAMHYDTSMLSKATNQFPKEVYFFKVSCHALT